MTSDPFQTADGSALLAAFARAAAIALREDAAAPVVLEAAAMGLALGALGLVAQAPDRERLASRTRRVLLGAAALRQAVSEDDDALDALELALDQAKRGIALLGGGPLASIDGAPTHEPTPHELAQLLRGELDGHAAADVAIRLHRSGARERYAAFLPGSGSRRLRLAADSAPVVRDPALGRALGTATLGTVALEAFAFDHAIVSVYAEPPIGIVLVSSDARLASRAIETSGYLELALAERPDGVTLVLGDGEQTLTWKLSL
jgi:hypothetical protein